MDEPIKRRGRITTRGPGASRVRDADLALLQGPEPDFVSTDPWRALRILGEFVEGFDLLARVGPAVSVFGSARTGPDDPDYAGEARTRHAAAMFFHDAATSAFNPPAAP